MKNSFKCLPIFLVFSASYSYGYPVSQPAYQSPQYISAQTAVPVYTFKPSQPEPQGLQYSIQPQIQSVQPQYVRAQGPAVSPVYESSKEGLRNYGSQRPSALQQLQKPLQVSSPIYLSQIQSATLASQAKEAFASAQRTLPSPITPIARNPQPVATIARPVSQPVLRPQPQPQQYVRQPAQQYVTEQPQQYVRAQYVSEQPQSRYVQKPTAPQYRVPQPQQDSREKYQEEKEDYDPNPSYQFGFDVKDDLYTNYHNRKEQREGNVITGSYSVVDSDGFIRTVSYTADPKEGFKAEVTRQPTDIVVKIPKPQPQFQNIPRQQLQYVQEAPVKQQRVQQEQKQADVIYRYQ